MKVATSSRMRSDLLRIYAAAIDAVAPERLIERALTGAIDPRIPTTLAAAARIRILAVGKAALGMTLAVRKRLGDKIHDTLVVAPAPLPAEVPADLGAGLHVVTAAHPLPDEASVAAGRAALEFVTQAGAGELVLLLLSGGASALMAAPAPGIQLGEKVAVTSSLMRAGAPIAELNAVRKHLSVVKGGGLLRALGAQASMLGLILSDVPGNDLATIGSGPAVADSTTFADAIAVLKRRKLWGRTPEAVRDRLERGAAGEIRETVKPGDPALGRAPSVIIGDNHTACAAASAAAGSLGYEVEHEGELTGPAERICRDLATRLGGLAGRRRCVVAGGEPQVVVRRAGKGGRAQHCALTLALELAEHPPESQICALFAGTDGVDGPTEAAGAIITTATVSRAREARLDPQAILEHNDSYRLFAALGDLIITGPTGTNVTDLFIALVEPSPQ